jgi:hypothetical protein
LGGLRQSLYLPRNLHDPFERTPQLRETFGQLLANHRGVVDEVDDRAAEQIACDGDDAERQQHQQCRRYHIGHAVFAQETDDRRQRQRQQESQDDRHEEGTGEGERVDRHEDEDADEQRTHQMHVRTRLDARIGALGSARSGGFGFHSGPRRHTAIGVRCWRKRLCGFKVPLGRRAST